MSKMQGALWGHWMASYLSGGMQDHIGWASVTKAQSTLSGQALGYPESWPLRQSQTSVCRPLTKSRHSAGIYVFSQGEQKRMVLVKDSCGWINVSNTFFITDSFCSSKEENSYLVLFHEFYFTYSGHSLTRKLLISPPPYQVKTNRSFFTFREGWKGDLLFLLALIWSDI